MLELNIQPDHVHLVVEIPPKYAVSEFVGYLKGKLAIRLPSVSIIVRQLLPII